MSVTFFQVHRNAVRVLSFLLVIVTFMFCMIPPKVQAAEWEGWHSLQGLIAAILASFGIVFQPPGTFEEYRQMIYDGQDTLIREYGEAVHDDPEYLYRLFDGIENLGYGVLVLKKGLIEAIKEFRDWMRTDKGVSENNPVNIGRGLATITYNGVTYPYIETNFRSRGYSSWSFYYVGGADFQYYDGKTNYAVVQSIQNYSQFGRYVINSVKRYTWTYYTSNDSGGFVFGQENSNNTIRFYPGGTSAGYRNYYAIGLTYGIRSDTNPPTPYVALLGIESYSGSLSPGTIITISSTEGLVKEGVSTPQINGASPGFIVYDMPKDIDSLVQNMDEDDTVQWTMPNPDNFNLPNTGDNIINPVVPRDLTLPDINGLIGLMLNSLSIDSLTDSIIGELNLNIEINPSHEDEVPSMFIPSGGWFQGVWHYVVDTFDFVRRPLAFIGNEVMTIFPDELMTSVWAVVVLALVVGVLMVFLL